MSCAQINTVIDDYMDGLLPELEMSSVRDHVAVCEDCKVILQQEQIFRNYLASRPVPAVSAAQIEQIFKAVKTRKHASVHKSFAAGFAGAMAAGLVLLLAAGVFIPDFKHENTASTITLSLNETKNIQLVFNATEDITNATMTLELPAHLELKGFPGRQQLAWSTNLHKGENGLTLPVVAHAAISGDLVATISYGDTEKVFHIRPIVGPGQSPGLSPGQSTLEFYELHTDFDSVG